MQSFKGSDNDLLFWVMMRQKNIMAEKGETITRQWLYYTVYYTVLYYIILYWEDKRKPGTIPRPWQLWPTFYNQPLPSTISITFQLLTQSWIHQRINPSIMSEPLWSNYLSKTPLAGHQAFNKWTSDLRVNKTTTKKTTWFNPYSRQHSVMKSSTI